MSEWKTYKLGDLVTFQRGHDLTRTQMQDGKYPVAGSNGIIGFHNEFTTKAPSITIGRSGNIGNAYYFDIDFWAHNTTLYIKEFKKCAPKFIYYLLQTMNFGGHNSGSAVPSLNRNYIHPIEVKAPDLPTQTAIAQILTSLDDKIELNLQMNQTLEAMAQAIFKEWFVDFKFPGFDGELLGGLPKGWRHEAIDDNIEFLNGLALQKFPPLNEDEFLPVIKIREIKQGFTNASDKASTELPEKYVIYDGDILFSWSGSLEVVLWCEGKGALNQHLFKVSSNVYPKWFYFFWVREYLPLYKSIAEGKATTMGHIQRRHLTDSIINVPNKELMNLADSILSPILDKIQENKIQIQTLTQTRDTLLPKLMSGKIKVKA